MGNSPTKVSNTFPDKFPKVLENIIIEYVGNLYVGYARSEIHVEKHKKVHDDHLFLFDVYNIKYIRNEFEKIMKDDNKYIIQEKRSNRRPDLREWEKTYNHLYNLSLPKTIYGDNRYRMEYEVTFMKQTATISFYKMSQLLEKLQQFFLDVYYFKKTHSFYY